MSIDERKQLEIINGKYTLYAAGLPYFPRNFTRDSVIALLLLEDWAKLKEQLLFCMSLQGSKQDSYTGEEVGKIFHEFPGVDLRGKNTLYNACDTTALFLLGCKYYVEKTNDWSFVDTNKDVLYKAVEYIKNHIKNGLFTESPSYSGADSLALKVTYWKDSEITNREDGMPIYPVVYFLAHAQNMAGMRAAAFLLKDGTLTNVIQQMQEGLHTLFSIQRSTFAVARDVEGDIFAESDDFLHGLFYLEPKDLTDIELESIVSKSMLLETPLGYRTNSADFCNRQKSYHSCTLWPFEQAIIYLGAQKFEIPQIQSVARRITDKLNGYPEFLLLMGEDQYEAGGCNPQLWTLACLEFFKNHETTT